MGDINNKMVEFIASINVINESLKVKIKNLQDKVGNSISKEYIEELENTIKDLEKLSNDTGSALTDDNKKNILAAIDGIKKTDKYQKGTPEKKQAIENIVNKANEILNANNANNGGKGKTRKQRKQKKQRKQRKSKKHI